MFDIFLGAFTFFLMLISCGGCFILGLYAGRKGESSAKAEAIPTEEQKRMAEGFTNLLNYANRHNK